MPALETYRTEFRPSARLAQPYVMLGVNVVAADTDDEARRSFTSLQQAFVNLRRGHPGPLPPPADDFDEQLTPMDRLGISEVLSCSIVGSPESVARGMAEFIAATGANELMVASQIFEHAARLRSYEITAGIRDQLGRE